MLKTAPPKLAEVLTLRQQLAKSSVKKYQAMQNAVCADGRTRGMFQFYGANRTGRFAGRIVQLQNLPQNHIPDLAEARSLVKCGDYEALELLYENVPEVLSELIRTAFVPKPGYKFIVSDFSAIEARVLSWLAGEKWRMDTFAEGGDIYCATAERMFHCKVVKHGENGELRQKGKQCELSCGYGGSVGALKAMGALEAGMREDELKPLVDAWRSANPKIVEFWWDVDCAVMKTVRERIPTRVKNIRFSWKSGMLFITLPSGRQLAYVKPRIGENQFGGDCVTYMGIGGTKKWERLESYGPKFVENIGHAYEEKRAAHQSRKQDIIDTYGWDSEELKAWYDEKEAMKFPFEQGACKAYRAWASSVSRKEDELEMDDFLWEKEVSDFIDTLRKAGIKTFVYTNQSTAVMENLHQFAAAGCTMDGLCTITRQESRWGDEEPTEVMGVRFSVN